MPRGVTVWFTGLSGAGKSTLAHAVAEALQARGRDSEILDGDALRLELCPDLGFTPEDRRRHIQRVVYVARLLARHGVVVLAALISPYRSLREYARQQLGDFIEVYVKASWETLLRRDPKGLYRRALAGEIPHFTGLDDPYEEPEAPDLVCDTDRETVERCTARILALLEARGYLGRGSAPGSPGSIPALAGAEAGSAPAPPHGGVLVDRRLEGEAREEARERAARLPRVPLDEVAERDLWLLGTGAYSPLEGFMTRREYESVLAEMRLPGGLVWTLPITLQVEEELARRLRGAEEAALVDRRGRVLGILQVQDVYPADPCREARLVYGTQDPAHPGVARLYRQGTWALGGPVWVLEPPDLGPLGARCLTPAETRRYITQQGWRTVVGFQTRNPVHRAHEYLQKVALELVDGLLLHPLLGPTKEDDLPAEVRWRCYEAVLAYFPAGRVLLAGFPAAMRYAGPREAVFHALCRKNYGCTHFIVGRDAAGVGSYYGPYDAQALVNRFGPAELGIVPLCFEHAFYCRRCEGMASLRTCPHSPEHRVELSGTRVRRMLRAGEAPPREFTRPEVARLLVEALAGPVVGSGRGAEAASP